MTDLYAQPFSNGHPIRQDVDIELYLQQFCRIHGTDKARSNGFDRLIDELLLETIPAAG